ncbi:type II and III secretion system protein [Thermosipho ferrireducens]|uniref:Type II and III secretion system protein n=1 Tax=Thermosipho ferrireducens TaxID=2571116 RepID=A0ABX7S8N4_9BACT|nr:type II and III secretion system protein [Thermosipho ferrireducens]QTA37636.1 type II and III secretion system protein [Thermosipho ferrireducens]
MKKIAILILTSFSLILLASITNITYYESNGEIISVFEFDKPIAPSYVEFGWNESKTVYYLQISKEYIENTYLPVSKGPLEGIQIISTNGGINIFFFTIVPVKADWYVLNNKIYVKMPRSVSKKLFSFSYVNASLDIVARDFSEALGINISLYESVREKTVNLKVDNATIEESLRLLLLNNPEISYAYGPNKTLYIGSPEDIQKNFARYWQVYEGELNVEKLKSLLASGTFVKYLENKSKIFVYGGVREHRMIADAIAIKPTKSWYYYPYSVSTQTVTKFMENISEIYSVKYVILDGLKKVAIYSSSEAAKTIGRLISYLKEEIEFEKEPTVKIKVKYPDRIFEVLSSLGVNVQKLGNYIVVPKSKKEIVLNLEKDHTVGNPYRLVLEDVKIDTVQNALRYLGISESDGIVTESNNKVFVTLYVSDEIYRRFIQFLEIASMKTAIVNLDENELKKYKVTIIKKLSNGNYLISGKEEEIDKIKLLVSKQMKSGYTKLTIKLLPTDPPFEVLQTLLEATGTKINDEIVVFSVKKDLVREFENKLNNLRKEFGKKYYVITDYIIDENLEKAIKDMYNVDISKIGDNYLLIGYDIEPAKDFIKRFGIIKKESSYYNQTIKTIKVLLENSQEIENILKEYYNVDAKYYSSVKLLFIKGTPEKIKSAEEFLKTIITEKIQSSSEKVSTEFLKQPLQKELLSSIESITGVKIYTFDSGSLLVGNKQNIDSAKAILDRLLTDATIVKVSTQLSEKDIAKIINVYNNKVNFSKVGNYAYFYGNPDIIKSIINEITTITNASTKTIEKPEIYVENEKVYIRVNQKPLPEVIVKTFTNFGKSIVLSNIPETPITINLEGVSFEQFITVLKTYNVKIEKKDDIYYAIKIQAESENLVELKNNKLFVRAENMPISFLVKEVYNKFGYSVVVNGVSETISMVLNNSSLEDFERILKSKVNIIKNDNIVFITPIEKSEKELLSKTLEGTIRVNDGLITINAESVSLEEIIKSIMQKLGYSVVFSKKLDKSVNIYAKDITFDTFKRIAENYNVNIEKQNNLYFVSETSNATKTVDSFIFAVPRGADKINELVKFYGGSTYIDTDSGLVIATGINAKIAGEIKQLIEKISQVKLASIEVKVIDEETLDSFVSDLGTMFISDLGTITNRDMQLRIGVGDARIDKIMKKLISIGNEIGKAEIGINTTAGALEKNNGKSNVIASPNIVAKSGETANILIGDKYPIILKQGENQTETIQYLESGISLSITPYINADDTIDLSLQIKVSSFDWSVSNPYGLPKENTREVNTSLTLKNGQTLIIGGLTREEKSNSVSKLPILGDLPIIGKFFKTEKESTIKRNIIVFITAKVVK